MVLTTAVEHHLPAVALLRLLSSHCECPQVFFCLKFINAFDLNKSPNKKTLLIWFVKVWALPKITTDSGLRHRVQKRIHPGGIGKYHARTPASKIVSISVFVRQKIQKLNEVTSLFRPLSRDNGSSRRRPCGVDPAEQKRFAWTSYSKIHAPS